MSKEPTRYNIAPNYYGSGDKLIEQVGGEYVTYRDYEKLLLEKPGQKELVDQLLELIRIEKVRNIEDSNKHIRRANRYGDEDAVTVIRAERDGATFAFDVIEQELKNRP